jgi:NADP-dependent 3-hydroxy acid dehydrogenase YdfG
MNETILVTGATSMVGREVVKLLSSATRNVNIKAAGRSVENVKRAVNSDSRLPILLVIMKIFYYSYQV